jgi:hypothetical protein
VAIGHRALVDKEESTTMSLYPRRQILWGIIAGTAVVLTACGPSAGTVPTPIGADIGRNTFIYMYTDN